MTQSDKMDLEVPEPVTDLSDFKHSLYGLS